MKVFDKATVRQHFCFIQGAKAKLLIFQLLDLILVSTFVSERSAASLKYYQNLSSFLKLFISWEYFLNLFILKHEILEISTLKTLALKKREAAEQQQLPPV